MWSTSVGLSCARGLLRRSRDLYALSSARFRLETPTIRFIHRSKGLIPLVALWWIFRASSIDPPRRGDFAIRPLSFSSLIAP